jgi:hypothetical protein
LREADRPGVDLLPHHRQAQRPVEPVGDAWS